MNDEEKLIQIAIQLLSKTRKDLVNWEETADPTLFQTTMEDYTVTIDKVGGSRFDLHLRNQKGRAIASVQVREGTASTTNYNTLSNLYEIARRQALKIDSALDDVISKLSEDET
jgi:hypothetical protein